MQFYLNNIMNDNIYISDDFEIPSLNTETEVKEIKGRDGFILGEKKVKGYNFTIPMYYINHDDKVYQDIVNELTDYFNRDTDVRLRFENEYWYWNARFDGTIQFRQNTKGFVSFELRCIITDPYKYSNEKYTNVSGGEDHLSILNNGTADTYPIFKATAYHDSTMFSISKNDEDYFMIGEPEDVFKNSVKATPTVYSDHFNSTVGWSYNTNANTVNDPYVGGGVGGTTSIKNGALTIGSLPNDYAGWRGSAMKRSISESMNDFDITVQVRLFSARNQEGTSKSMVHLYDSNNELVAALGLLNSSSVKRDASLFVAVFDEFGNRKTICNVKNSMFNATGHTHIRLTRTGKEYQIKSWRVTDWTNYSKSDIYSIRFIDSGDLYDRPVRQVGTYLGRHTNSVGIQTDPAIYYLNISRPQGSKENEIPYIVEVGDVIEINMDKEVILINGEPMTQLKNFGSNYFSVDSGLTEILMEPQDTFDLSAEWRDRFY